MTSHKCVQRADCSIKDLNSPTVVCIYYPSNTSSSNLGDDPFDGPRMKESSALRLQEGGHLCRGQRRCLTTIEILPDNVLLEIFDFYREDRSSLITAFLTTWRWQNLTHVCRRWRDVVFGSPRRLKLQILCTKKTPTRTSLDIWPPFPIAIIDWSLKIRNEENLENITTAIERRDRILHIDIHDIDGPAMEHLAAIMQEPFPLLTTFHLLSFDKSAAVLPKAFLGGSAPLLEWFVLDSIPFPAFPGFILSATRVTYICLFDIPDSGYISPEEMATCLASLPNLGRLVLGFRSPLSRPLQIGLPSPTRVVLPALTRFYFKGTSEYLEDFLARTHIPLLKWLDLRFFMDLIFDIPRLHTLIVQFGPLSTAWVMFGSKTIAIRLGLPARMELIILCEEQDWQLSSMAQVCNQHLPLSSVEQLNICVLDRGTLLHWDDDMDSSQWLELLHPFIAVRSLYVSKQFVPFITSALQELTGERNTEVLPVLKNLFLEGFEPSGPLQEAIKPFLSARQLSVYPIVIHSEQPLPLLAPPHWTFLGDG